MRRVTRSAWNWCWLQRKLCTHPGDSGRIRTSTSKHVKKRQRQHVNPLTRENLRLVPGKEDLDWSAHLDDPSLPFHLDLGCAHGEYLLTHAQSTQGRQKNWIGVEIRRRVIERAKLMKEKEMVGNVHFLNANLLAAETLRSITDALPAGQPESVSILHPDPNFKRRKRKRAVVTEGFVEMLGDCLPRGAHVFLQSDLETLCAEMADIFHNSKQFVEEKNLEPLTTIPTDRERAVLATGGRVWKVAFRKIN